MMGPSICFSCVRARDLQPKRTPACAAFPRGIPEDILAGGFDHRNPHDGDHGIRWELKPGREGALRAWEKYTGKG